MAELHEIPAPMASCLRRWMDPSAPFLESPAAGWLREDDSPVACVTAADEADVAELMRLASENGWKVAPVGGATQIGAGNPPGGVDLVIYLRQMNQVVEYSPADMVVTVQAGITLRDLQAALHAQGQYLPMDPLCDEDSTIGGLVATGAAGPLRALYGTWRDLSIAARAVTAAGDVVRAGAKVVKNVAGYDMTKLFIGAHGTLGIVTEWTCKVRPLPLCETVCVLTGSREQVDELRARVMDSTLVPATFEAICGWDDAPGAEPGARRSTMDRWMLAVGAHDTRAAVREQGGRLRQWAGALSMSCAQLENDDAREFWRAYGRRFRDAPGVFRHSFAPSAILARAQEWRESAAKSGLSTGFSLTLNAGTGRWFVDDAAAITPERVQDWRLWVEQRGGRLEVERAPLAVKRRIDSFPPPGNALAYMKALKRQMDPGAILNPGRLMGGI